jgi:hypothetical protein
LNRHGTAPGNISKQTASSEKHNTPRPAPRTDRDALRDIFERRDGDAKIALASSMMGNKPRLVNALGIKGKGLYHQCKFDEAQSTFNSISNESGDFKTQVLCGFAEFLLTQYQDYPERDHTFAISLAEAAVANRTG